jgi:very-short-patch-repair endonuclease
VAAGSSKKVWWKCPVADDHEWPATVASRAVNGNGCACCAGRRLSVTNRLDIQFPEIAAEWHPTKNGDLTPAEVLAGWGKKTWWKCPIADDHEWPAIVDSRTRLGRGCPSCTMTPRSAQEMSLAHELSALIKFDLEIHKVRCAGQLRDVDIVLDDLNMVVEFDGNYWHQNKAEKDRDKTVLLEEAGWQVIRVRQRPLDSIHVNDVIVDETAPAKTVADLVLKKILQVTGTKIQRLDEYLGSDGPWRETEALAAIYAYQAERAAKKAAKGKTGE